MIAIVTALPKEHAAVELMLDERKDHVVSGDPGRYVVGRIGGHAVVVALLPKMGTDPAASITSHLLRSFPAVTDVLMVGIAGGVPSPSSAEKHVRLGDVVVSVDRGVVQFDFGKRQQALAGGRAAGSTFTIRATAPPPSMRLIQEVRILEARQLRGERPWEECLARAAMLEGARRPAATLDVLHDSVEPARSVPHPADPARRDGFPRIHHGVIASSNALVKDPVLRDLLRDEHDARAVEMEGSGIATATWIAGSGYLLIRGVCDYCDTFKNDAWQEYAAAVAAAYARALLVSLPSSAVVNKPADYQRRLRKVLFEHFTRDELELLCKDVQDDLAVSGVKLRLNLDVVGGDSLEIRCLNLCEYLERRGYLAHLQRAVARARPELAPG